MMEVKWESPSDSAVKSWRERIVLALSVLYNGILFIVCTLNIQANNFVIKSSIFNDTLAYVNDPLRRWIVWAPLLSPLWFYVLNRYLKFNPRTRLFPIVGFIAVALLTNYPFMSMDLGAASLDPLEFWKHMVRDGFTQPTALLFFVFSLALSLSRENLDGRSDGKGVSEKSFLFVLFGALLAGIVLRILLSGPALPRLEDELAYHIQALVFEAGALKGALFPGEEAALGGAAFLERYLSIPYIIFEDGRYYSSHMHGWSWILAGLSILRLKYLACAIFTFINLGLFYKLSKLVFEPEQIIFRRLALGLFACAPILLLLSNTLMSHTFALSLTLAYTLCWLEIRNQNSSVAGGIFRVVVLYGVLFLVSILFLFTRPQVMAPVVAGILFYEGLYFLRLLQLKEFLQARGVFVRGFFMGVGGLAGLFFLILYARLYESNTLIFMGTYMEKYLVAGCQSLGFGEGYGCFPSYGTMGHSFRKFLLNLGEILSRYNQELAAGGLPLFAAFLVLLLRNGRVFFRDFARPYFAFLLISLFTALLFALYFHHGGESYRGRYLSETSFAFYLVFAILLSEELKRPLYEEIKTKFTGVMNLRILMYAPLFFLIANLAIFQIKGDYFHLQFHPYHTLKFESGEALKNSLVLVEDLDYAGGIDTNTGYAEYIDEFHPEKRIRIPREKVRRYLNLGLPTALGVIHELTPGGLPRDRAGNVIVSGAAFFAGPRGKNGENAGEDKDKRIDALRVKLGLSQTVRLSYPLPRLSDKKRGVRRWYLTPYKLDILEETGK